MIDLRSDTVTQPGKGMLKAMKAAPVGDDVYREVPTVKALEARVADMAQMLGGGMRQAGVLAAANYALDHHLADRAAKALE